VDGQQVADIVTHFGKMVILRLSVIDDEGNGWLYTPVSRARKRLPRNRSKIGIKNILILIYYQHLLESNCGNPGYD
jgi:hypothetical protein